MNTIAKAFLSPVNLWGAYQYNKQSPKYDKSKNDTELFLYSEILKSDMLHFGYFDDINLKPETISIKDVEDAQHRYCDLMIDKIEDTHNQVLDVGCGMGGLSGLMLKKGLNVQALTPNLGQKNYINSKHSDLTVHNMKFEQLETTDKFGTIINSESLQYIDLDAAFDKVNSLLIENGRWLITDFFRIEDNTINKSGHRIEDFLASVEKHGWKIVHEQDITLNSLPTLKLAILYYKRFMEPIGRFAAQKIKFKKPWLYYLTQGFRSDISKKAQKELEAIDPDKFVKEKKYMFYVLEKA